MRESMEETGTRTEEGLPRSPTKLSLGRMRLGFRLLDHYPVVGGTQISTE